MEVLRGFHLLLSLVEWLHPNYDPVDDGKIIHHYLTVMVFYGQTVDDIPDRGYVLYITALVMVLVAALFVVARLSSRIYTTRMGADDVTIGIALVGDRSELNGIDVKSNRFGADRFDPINGDYQPG